MQHIRGAGGKGGNNHVPTEADDSLQSVQYATVLDLLSEGEIQGLDDGYKSIYLDGTPVQSSTGDDNFSGYIIRTRNGTLDQLHIPDLEGTETEVQVTTQVTNSNPITRQIASTHSETDRLRVTIQIPILRKIESDGDIVGNEVKINIEHKANGAGTWTSIFPRKTSANDLAINNGYWDQIKGKCSTAYLRDYVFPMPTSYPVDIRVTRVSSDDESGRNSSETIWSSYTRILDEKLRYRHSALAYLRFDSRQFGSIPRRKYLIRGIKVRIPNTASVDTTTYLGRLTYSGIWTGTLGAATWCSDPAWCLYDLLTSERYGVGVPESALDKWEFYKISQYCNTLVSDGKGGQEPRFSCNLLINQRKDVYSVIKEMTSLFRGMSYYGAGSLAVLQDSPTDPSYLLGPSNVINGEFEYTGTSEKVRHTAASVAYQSYDALGEVKFEYVEDVQAIAKYGVVSKSLRALGCYSKAQAHRMGLWALKSEQILTETCTFGVGLDSGVVLRPGMVIDIADPLKNTGIRRSGRISSGSTTTAIKIDSATDFSVSITENPKLLVVLSTGLSEERNIQSWNLASNPPVINVSSAFSEAPQQNAKYLIQTDDNTSLRYRVVNVEEKEDGAFAVTALKYNESLYSSVDTLGGSELEFRGVEDISIAPDPVTSIFTQEFLYSDGQGVFVGCDVSWQHGGQAIFDGSNTRVGTTVSNATSFKVTFRVDDDNWATVDTTSPSISLRQGGNFGALRAGKLQLLIQAFNYLNKGSAVASHSVQLAGKTAAPGNVEDFTMIPTNGLARLQWTQSSDLDVTVGGLVRIRHSSALTGVTWANSSSIHDDVTGTAKEAYCDLKSGTYLIKFIDSGGRASTKAAMVEFTKPKIAETFNISSLNRTEQTSFGGTKINCVVESGELLSDYDRAFAPASNHTYTSLYVVDHIDDYVIVTALGSNIGHSYAAGHFISITTTSGTFPPGVYEIKGFANVGGCSDAILIEHIPAFTNGAVNIKPGLWSRKSTYLFSTGVDLGDIFNMSLESTLETRGFFPSNPLIDSWSLLDSVLDFDGNSPSDCDAKLSIRTSQIASPYPATWAANTSYSNGAKVRAVGQKESYIFECITSGSSAGSEPDWVEPLYWTAGKDIALGTKIKSTSNDEDYIFECINAGVTGKVEPAWPTAVNGTVLDPLNASEVYGDQVEWKAVIANDEGTNKAKWKPIYPPDWSSWRPFNNAEFSARKYELKLDMNNGSEAAARVAVSQLKVEANAPMRSINGVAVSSSTQDVTVTFPNKFYALPAIGITMSATTSGDYFTITSATGTAFTVSIYNSGGTRQARSFQWAATGYGKGN